MLYVFRLEANRANSKMLPFDPPRLTVPRFRNGWLTMALKRSILLSI